MANDMSEIIRQLSFLKAGGKPQGMGFTDKLNQVFQTIANTGEGLKGIAKEAIARRKPQGGAFVFDTATGKTYLDNQEIPSSAIPTGANVMTFDSSKLSGVGIYGYDKATKKTYLDSEEVPSSTVPRKAKVVTIDSTQKGKDEEKKKEDMVSKRKDDSARKAVELIRNYYKEIRAQQSPEGREIGKTKSLILGAKGAAASVPIVGRAFAPETSQIVNFRKSQGARLAKAFGDAGNIALQEQKNALQLLAPLGTRNLDIAEAQAITSALETISNRTPKEEEMYQRVRKSFGGGIQPARDLSTMSDDELLNEAFGGR